MRTRLRTVRLWVLTRGARGDAEPADRGKPTRAGEFVILGAAPLPRLRELQIATAVCQLLGREALAHIEPGFSAGRRFTDELAINMLESYARNEERRRELRDFEEREGHVLFDAEVRGIDDGRTCEACRELDGRVFAVAALPELPLPECSSGDGCRCRFVCVDPKEG